jgi:hypothetical protein
MRATTRPRGRLLTPPTEVGWVGERRLGTMRERCRLACDSSIREVRPGGSLLQRATGRSDRPPACLPRDSRIRPMERQSSQGPGRLARLRNGCSLPAVGAERRSLGESDRAAEQALARVQLTSRGEQERALALGGLGSLGVCGRLARSASLIGLAGVLIRYASAPRNAAKSTAVRYARAA